MKLKGLAGLLGLAFGSTLVITSSSAAAAELGSVTVDQLAQQLQVTWPMPDDLSAAYLVDDRTGEVVSAVSSETLTVALPKDSSVSMLIVGVREGRALPLAQVRASSPPAGSGVKWMAALTTPDGTALAWGDIPGVESWIIESDNNRRTVSVAEASAPVALGDSAQITMTGTDITGQSYEYGFDIRPSSTSYAADSSSTSQSGVVPAGVRTMRTSKTMYETYIPMQYVDAPDAGKAIGCEKGDGSDYWYSGDNREAAWSTGKYRTAASATYNWPGASIFTSQGISPTKRYRKVGGKFYYDSSKTANGTSFEIRPLRNDGRYGRTVIEHSVGNPYCTGFADIDYTNQQDMYSDGSYWTNGEHDKMPNHQLYRYDVYSDDTYTLRKIFNHKYESPSCLVTGRCAKHLYTYQG